MSKDMPGPPERMSEGLHGVSIHAKILSDWNVRVGINRTDAFCLLFFFSSSSFSRHQVTRPRSLETNPERCSWKICAFANLHGPDVVCAPIAARYFYCSYFETPGIVQKARSQNDPGESFDCISILTASQRTQVDPLTGQVCGTSKLPIRSSPPQTKQL